MTRAEFLAALAADPAARWDDPAPHLRATRDGCPDPAADATANHCPITAAAERKTGRHFHVGEWNQAAAALGLEYPDALNIVFAADHWSDDLDAGNTEKTVRAELLTALKLTEPAP